jgi:hypothetical protein
MERAVTAFLQRLEWRNRELDPRLERMERTRRERTARAVRHRRQQVGLSISAAARAAGIQRSAWVSLESRTRETEPFQPATQKYIEWVLGWAPGSLFAVSVGLKADLLGHNELPGDRHSNNHNTRSAP